MIFPRQLYYEFMCFDVSKVVRSPECDHGHDEESRNGTIGERSNFKKNPMHTQDHGDA